MKKRFLLSFIVLLSLINVAFCQDTTKNKLAWWQEAKFGLFLHWGLYSATSLEWNGHPAKGNEHMMWGEKIPLKQYAQIAQSFNPTQFDAEVWVKDAKNAGMKYVVITAKHHEGYAMYDSPSSGYNIVKTTPFARDPMKDLAKACKKYGLKLGFYYSLGRDWEDPDATTKNGYKSNMWDYPNENAKDFDKYFKRKVIPQVTELLTQYGPIGVIWFDTPEETTLAESQELRQLINRLQPNCIINSRIGNGLGDYDVLEQQIGSDISLSPWESCITMSGHWGYSKYDKAWKSPELLVRQLVEIVCKGGNLLLNIGVDNKGAFPQESRTNLDQIGEWMKINAEAIYGTRPWTSPNEYGVVQKDSTGNTVEGKSDNDYTSKATAPDLYFNSKANTIYLFARSWKQSQIVSEKLASLRIVKIICLGSTEKIKWELSNGKLVINMPRQLPKTSIPIYVFKIFCK